MRHGILSLLSGMMLLAAMPTSTNYGLNNYGFGSGGTSNSSSTNYRVNGITGEQSNVQSSSTNFKARSGNNNSQQSNVPNAPTFTNPSSWYDKLKFVVNPGGTSPSNTKYSIAISSDGFVTTKYIQADDTIGTTKVYQTYTAWGGASGQNVIGLTYSTTYQIKANSIRGDFTETEYGPTASASTAAPSLTFNIATDSQSTPPYSTNFSGLLPATVVTASDKILVTLSTNANSGATVYINSLNAGLKSTSSSNTINSATADLSVASTGYGAQGVSATQTSGGPLALLSPYNAATNNVGKLNTTLTGIFSATAPITGGSGSLQLKAKAAALTPAAGDYTDTLSLTAAGSF